jgi:uncharacterized membrane protein YfcA
MALLLIGAGFAAGVINALSGGGSFITFPLLLWAGLPPQTANATNRIAIIAQCVTGVATYHQHGVRPWAALPRLIVPALAGALVGALLAARLDESMFRTVTAVLLVAVAATILLDPKRWSGERPDRGEIAIRHLPLVFLMGVYGGFLQIGLGTLMLAFFVMLGGFDVVRGNALKFALVPVYQLLALGLFARSGQVDWGVGAVLAIGNALGGIVGARLVVAKGTKWVPVVVVISTIAAVFKLITG